MLRRCVALLATAVGARTDCLLSHSDGVAVIEFNRPSRKNSLGRVMLRELEENIAWCRDNDAVRCVVLASVVEGIFCAGADLKERKEMTPDEARTFVSSLRRTFCALEDLTVPTFAALDGHALGGGLEIALACDMRIASQQVRIGVPETSLAIIPGAGGTQRLAKAVGLPHALQLALTALPVSALRAAEIGLINECVTTGTARDRAMELAKAVAQNGPVAVKAAKAAIVHGYGKPRDEGMRIEQQFYEKVLATQDRLEGLAAFAEKRKPIYKGV